MSHFTACHSSYCDHLSQESQDQPAYSFTDHLPYIGLRIGFVQRAHPRHQLHVFGCFLFSHIQDVIDSHNSYKNSTRVDNRKCNPVVVTEHSHSFFLIIKSTQCHKCAVHYIRNKRVGFSQNQLIQTKVINQLFILVCYINNVDRLCCTATSRDMFTAFGDRPVLLASNITGGHLRSHALGRISKQAPYLSHIVRCKSVQDLVCEISRKLLKQCQPFVRFQVAHDITELLSGKDLQKFHSLG